MSKQTIRKSKPKNRYMMLPNQTAQNDKLSYEALGMLTYIQSLPDDWVLHVSTLPRKACGRDKAYKIIAELIETGYCKRTKILNDKKQVVTVEYEVSDYPEFLTTNPLPENPYTEKPDTENQELQRKEVKKEIVKKDIAPLADKPLKPQEILALAMGINLVKGDWSNYGKVTKTLIENGIPCGWFNDYVLFVRKLSATSGNWEVTVNSLVGNGRMSKYLTEKSKQSFSLDNSQQSNSSNAAALAMAQDLKYLKELGEHNGS